MDGQGIAAVALSGSASVDNLSIWALFWQADYIVKFVVILLAIASVWTWALIFDKSIKLKRLNRSARRFENRFWSGVSLEALYNEVAGNPKDPFEVLFVTGMQEWAHQNEKSGNGSKVPNVQWVDRMMQTALEREMDGIEKQMGFLATVGSTAPFVGLFGTVWGIMSSFQSIAASKNTSLAVVAPGIAEALFATALGLLAAIPAVIAYNRLSNDINRYGVKLDGFSSEFCSVLSRHTKES